MQKKNIRRALGLVAVCVAVLVSTGCSTVATMAQHRNLDVQSQVSESIFIDPMSPADKIVYLRVRNTSGRDGLDIRTPVVRDLQTAGWRVTQDPDKANVLLQVNIRQAGEAKKNAIQAAMNQGYGGGILGSGAAAAGAVAVAGGDIRGVGAAALAGGAADFVGGLLVKNVYYSVISDVQISQRGKNGQTFEVTHGLNQGGTDVQGAMQGLISMAQGRKTSVQSQSSSEVYTETSEFKRKSARVLVSAEKVNLSWEDAQQPIADKLALTLGGML